MHIMFGETTLAPLILRFVKRVLGIGSITIELTQSENHVVDVGHQHRVLISGNTFVILAIGLHKCQ